MGYSLTASGDDLASTPETPYPRAEKEVSGHRFYQPETGRWVNRDLIGDKAFIIATPKLPFVDDVLDRMADPHGVVQALETVNPSLAKAVKARLKHRMEQTSQLENLCQFVANDPIARSDAFGLLWLGSYGNYCGPGWCANMKQSEADCYCNKSYKSVQPIDDMDRCCAVHDICLGAGGGKECDQRMCNCLKKINPEDLVHPGGPDAGEIWRWYRKMYGLFCTFDIPGH